MNNRKQKVESLMEQGYTESQAHYITDFTRRDVNKPYIPRPRKGWSVEELERLGVKVITTDDSDYGWLVTVKGKKRNIFVAKGTVYKDGSCKYYPCVAITYEGKQKMISLAVLIWVGFLKRDIPAGYVVDHIDNDSFNNDTSNLQLLTIRENLVKNPAKKFK